MAAQQPIHNNLILTCLPFSALSHSVGDFVSDIYHEFATDSPLSLRQAPDSPVERTEVDTVLCSGSAAPWTLSVTTSAAPLGTKRHGNIPPCPPYMYLFIFPRLSGRCFVCCMTVASVHHIPPSRTLGRVRTAGKVAGWWPAFGLVWTMWNHGTKWTSVDMWTT